VPRVIRLCLCAGLGGVIDGAPFPSTLDTVSNQVSSNWGLVVPLRRIARPCGHATSQVVVLRLGELRPLNPRVPGSIPGRPTGFHRTVGLRAAKEDASSGSRLGCPSRSGTVQATRYLRRFHCSPREDPGIEIRPATPPLEPAGHSTDAGPPHKQFDGAVRLGGASLRSAAAAIPARPGDTGPLPSLRDPPGVLRRSRDRPRDEPQETPRPHIPPTGAPMTTATATRTATASPASASTVGDTYPRPAGSGLLVSSGEPAVAGPLRPSVPKPCDVQGELPGAALWARCLTRRAGGATGRVVE
jgi:hypothetical protein